MAMSSTVRMSGASGAKSGPSVNLRMVAKPCWAMPMMSSKSSSSWRAVSGSIIAKGFLSNSCGVKTGHVGICRWAKSEKVGAISNRGKGRPVRFFFFLQGETVLVVQLLQQCEIVISLKLRKGNPADQRTSGVISRFLVHHWCGRLDGEHVVLLIRGDEGDGATLKVQSASVSKMMSPP